MNTKHAQLLSKPCIYMGFLFQGAHKIALIRSEHIYDQVS